MDILTNFPPSVHLDSLSFEFRQFQFDGGAGVGGWNIELQFELIADEVMSIGAGAFPASTVFEGLYFEPVVVLLLVGLDVTDDDF